MCTKVTMLEWDPGGDWDCNVDIGSAVVIPQFQMIPPLLKFHADALSVSG